MSNYEYGPFRPGPGRPPPYLAGREQEQSMFRRLLNDLGKGKPPPWEVVLHGPRGNGKTALLAWMEQEAALGSPVEVIRVTPSQFRSLDDLALRLRPRPWWRKLVPDSLSVKGVRYRSFGGKAPPLDELLRRRVKKKPLALLVDEAHTLDKHAGRDLLNCSQLVGAQHPFLLVLAGTPDLHTRLNTLHASFWDRAEICSIGRLEPTETNEALHRPFAAEGITVAEDAMEHMVGESHGYPFFIQLWGQMVWNSIRTSSAESSRQITMTEIRSAQKFFDRRKNIYYLRRFRELESRGLVVVGRAIAQAFNERSSLAPEDLDAAILRGLQETGAKKDLSTSRETLEHLGFIWREGGSPAWEPGIPSLMDYIASPDAGASV